MTRPFRYPALLCFWLLAACTGCQRRAPDDRAASSDAGRTPPPEPRASTSDSASIPAPSDGDAPKGWEEICAASAQKDIATDALPTESDKAKVKPGDSRRYYYGIGTDVDYVRARHAALVEREQQNGAFQGTTVLMMLYANGYGVERDLDLAIHLACSAGEGESEVKDRVLHLNGMKSSRQQRTFDFCDDVSGGLMEGYCAALSEQRRNAQREAELTALSATWPAEHKVALAKLTAALEKFSAARASGERDLSAADRSVVMTEEQAALRQTFLASLQSLERGQLPNHSAESYREADSELNRAYKEALSMERVDTTITPAGIKATEKAWLAYRDAWVRFGAQRYPSVAPEAWKAWLTLQRVEQLKAL